MTNGEYGRVKAQIAILKELLPVYSGKTLDNIIQGLEARVAEEEMAALKRAVASVDEAAMVGFTEFSVEWDKIE